MTITMDRVSVRDTAFQLGGMVKDAAVWGADSAKDRATRRLGQAKARLGKTKAFKAASERVEKINTYVQKPAVVKLTTTLLGVETIIGFFGCIGTSTMMFATGNPLFGFGVIFMYLFGLCVRYIMSVNALHGAVAA